MNQGATSILIADDFYVVTGDFGVITNDCKAVSSHIEAMITILEGNFCGFKADTRKFQTSIKRLKANGADES